MTGHPETAPGEALAFLFAGQGSQKAGMGSALAARSAAFRALLDEADQALELPLRRLMAEGPDEELRRTEVAQPALLTLAVAHARHLKGLGLKPAALCGHSLGQYAALVAAGALAFGDCVRLVRDRGRLMQETVAEGAGAMAAIIGLGREEVYSLCDGSGAEVACHNAPGQTVISGPAPAVASLSERAVEEFGTVIPLQVSAPFHSSLLAPMVPAFEALVARLEIRDPRVPVIDNVTARPLGGAQEVRRSLVRQVTAPVLFEESLRHLHEVGIARYVQCGPGRTLLGFAKRVARGARRETFQQAAGSNGG